MAKRQTAVAARMDRKAAPHDKAAAAAKSAKHVMAAAAAGSALLPGAGPAVAAGFASGAALARKSENEASTKAANIRNRASAIDYLAKRKTSPQTKAAETSREARDQKPATADAKGPQATGRTKAYIDAMGRNYANGRAIKGK